MASQLLLHTILSSGIITPDDLVGVDLPTFTALTAAIFHLNADMAQYFLEMGANPYNTKGMPPLFALYSGTLTPASALPARRKIFNLLMQYPVNPNFLYKDLSILQFIDFLRNYLIQHPQAGSAADIQLFFDELDYEKAMIQENIRQQNLQSIQELRPNDESLF